MRIKIIMLIVALLVGSGSWWFLRKYHDTNTTLHEYNEMIKKKSSQYICPMHPQITSDKPGACLICGMDLVPIEDSKEDEDHDHEKHKKKGTDEWEDVSQSEDPSKTTPDGHTDFKLSLRKQQMIGIKTAKAQKKKLFKSIRAPGRIAFDPDLYTAQNEYLEALKQWRRVKSSPLSDVRRNTRQMINSSKVRLKVLGLSDSQIKDLAQKGFQSEGLLVSGKGQDNWIYADIFEVDLPYIKKGLSVQITANFLQGKILPARVISVDQVISPDTRTAKVRIQLLKTDDSIRPESYVNVTIFAPVGEHTSVSLEAIMDTGREVFVFVKKDAGRFEPRKVSVILETDNDAAISKGLRPGEEVVIGGNFMLDSESRLKAVIQDGTSSDEHNH
ncbi:MAG: efflux RND transporter periplasmic adaptor subunit [Bdellovibrionales bacterium]|nr:efflux RND transporter periplasmic adaptor subunit [Bdellovibrionales bacterium]